MYKYSKKLSLYTNINAKIKQIMHERLIARSSTRPSIEPLLLLVVFFLHLRLSERVFAEHSTLFPEWLAR